MPGNWAAHAESAGEVSPQLGSPTLLPWGPTKGVKKKKAVTPPLQYWGGGGGGEKPLAFLSHFKQRARKRPGRLDICWQVEPVP